MEWMIRTLVAPWIPVILMAAGIFIIYLVLSRSEKKLNHGKRSPFPREFLRSPGHTLYEQIEDLRLDFMGWFVAAMIWPPLLYTALLGQAYFNDRPLSPSGWVFYAIAGIGGIVVVARKAVQSFQRIRQLRLGYEGELGVGQELNQLMLHGFRVFHDFPGEQFNIDHIVIGKSGVFAIETKARSKPNTGAGKADSTVICDGTRLIFPTWTEIGPMEQAERQAAWLAKWLASAVGEVVTVKAAVVIPGWFVERKKIGNVLVFNAKESKQAIVDFRGPLLSDVMVQRIAHQVEGQCRDVAPRSFKAMR
ncbi:MAG: NERD domain-containing protein [Chromatiaceae bacterium]|nr:NERD domain-containing protein [Chromatiaceae bacterium]